ncbi:recombinase family protein [Quadrisphaera oryzae]|uniref:recombinase family protein n=1 Tax=Quadrisphaera TaxID=317661 RepID=UPI001646A057|nr:recombinase family protein [Quadrisphaera sp. RL12-1S]MBC3761072.1 recombinase family protein [Quadrisphaera sp. RL12-1S]
MSPRSASALPTTRAVIYTRASLDATGERASVLRQEEACRGLALARGWTVTEVLTDNSIGARGDRERPAWQAVLDRVATGAADVVVAWHMDRCTRNMADLEELILLCNDTGVGLATATGDIDLTTDTGRMVARILAAVAAAEVERKAARQRLANQDRATQGKPNTGGARAFGYAANHVDVVPEEADAIRWGAEQALAGASMRSIAEEWTARGLGSSRWKEMGARQQWSARGVRGVLTSPRYIGVRVYNGERMDAPGTWPAILTAEQHEQLTALLNDESRTAGTIKLGRTPSNLLTAIAECGSCGCTVNASKSRGRDVYVCRSESCTSRVKVERAPADAAVAAAVIARLTMLAAGTDPAASDDADADAAEARRRAADARQRKAEAAALFAEGTIDREQLGTISRRMTAVLVECEEVTRRARRSPVLADLLSARNVAHAWSALPLDRQRAVTQVLFSVQLLRVGERGWVADWTADDGLSLEALAA